MEVFYLVLIPLIQGRFLFLSSTWSNLCGLCLNPFGSGTFFIQFLSYYKKVPTVLIPLVQGRFLFTATPAICWMLSSLNPFGSGTFFIQ